jgi:hypothetical protein
LWQLLIISGAQQAPRAALETCSETLNVYLISVGLSTEDKQQLISSWQTSNLGQLKFFDFYFDL